MHAEISLLINKKEGRLSLPIFTKHIYSNPMKVIKNGQTTPVYSVFGNRAFEHIKLLVQSTET